VLREIAYARIPSFRRERGGLYNALTAVTSRLYRARMMWLHRGPKPPRPEFAEPMTLEVFAAANALRDKAMHALCRVRIVRPCSENVLPRCSWCGRRPAAR
jgi:hypothetical protein